MLTGFEDLPGAVLVEAGLRDERRRVESIEALLVQIAAPRLRRIGLAVPDHQPHGVDPELRLYQRLGDNGVRDPYSKYNALLRELTSFERAAEARLSRQRRLTSPR